MKSKIKIPGMAFLLFLVFFSISESRVNFTGQYKMTSDTVLLFLSIQQSGNTINGGLTGTTGADFKLHGKVEGEYASGTCSGSGIQLFFNFYFEENELYLQLIELDANGQPDWTRLKELVFNKSEQKNLKKPQDKKQNNISAAPDARPPSHDVSNSNTRIKVESMGLSFIPPLKWIAKKDAKSGNYIMGSNEIPGLILVLPHNYSSIQQLVDNASRGFVDDGINMYPSGDVETLSANTVGSVFSGSFNGTPAKAYVVGVVSPNGGGLLGLCLTESSKYSLQHKKSAIELAKSVRFFKASSKGNADTRWLAGKYYSYIGSTERKLTLCPGGTYYYNSESSYSGNFTNSGGGNTGAWGTANEDKGDGRWRAVGNRQQGTLIFISRDGSQEEQQYKVGDGCIYINGIKMGYNGTADCN